MLFDSINIFMKSKVMDILSSCKLKNEDLPPLERMLHNSGPKPNVYSVQVIYTEIRFRHYENTVYLSFLLL